jgi:hypothetical protein
MRQSAGIAGGQFQLNINCLKKNKEFGAFYANFAANFPAITGTDLVP